MNTQAFSVVELDANEMVRTDGGNPLVIAYLAGVAVGLMLARK